MTAYEVVAYRDGKWWGFEIPALTSPSPRGGERRIVAMGQTRSAADLCEAAADLASAWTDTPVSPVEIVLRYRIPDTVADAIAQANELDATGRAALEEAAVLRRKAVSELLSSGLNKADSAVVLGLSRQRVQQLAAG